MSLDASMKGRSYGPFRYQASTEKIREFALAVGGGVPSSSFSAAPPPEDLNPIYLDAQAGIDAGHGGIVAPPTFCVTFNIRPFAAACTDPRNALNLLLLVHGEQTYEFLEPIRPGDVLQSQGTITDAVEKGGKIFFTVVCESHNQHGRLAVRGTYTAVIRGG
jgi:acyl dehydratase